MLYSFQAGNLSNTEDKAMDVIVEIASPVGDFPRQM